MKLNKFSQLKLFVLFTIIIFVVIIATIVLAYSVAFEISVSEAFKMIFKKYY